MFVFASIAALRAPMLNLAAVELTTTSYPFIAATSCSWLVMSTFFVSNFLLSTYFFAALSLVSSMSQPVTFYGLRVLGAVLGDRGTHESHAENKNLHVRKPECRMRLIVLISCRRLQSSHVEDINRLMTKCLYIIGTLKEQNQKGVNM